MWIIRRRKETIGLGTDSRQVRSLHKRRLDYIRLVLQPSRNTESASLTLPTSLIPGRHGQSLWSTAPAQKTCLKRPTFADQNFDVHWVQIILSRLLSPWHSWATWSPLRGVTMIDAKSSCAIRRASEYAKTYSSPLTIHLPNADALGAIHHNDLPQHKHNRLHSDLKRPWKYCALPRTSPPSPSAGGARVLTCSGLPRPKEMWPIMNVNLG